MITHLPPEERPRERCLNHGASSLSLRQCLALILGTGPRGRGCLGLSEDLLRDYPSEDLFYAAMFEGSPLPRVPGFGQGQRARLEAVFEIARRALRSQALPKRSASSVKARTWVQAVFAEVPAEIRFSREEWLGVVLWKGQFKIGPWIPVQKGVRTHLNIDPVDLFAKVLIHRPQGFALIHNHPSGDPTPSPEDQLLSEACADVCLRLGLLWLGHGIVSAQDQHWMPGAGWSSQKRVP